MGRSVVKAALAHSDLVTAVGRTFHDNLSSMQDLHPPPTNDTKQTLDEQPPINSPYLPLLCDVRVRDTIDAVYRKSLAHWGRIDIIANCSGYGVIGACEDQDEYDIRNQFETNFWGTLNIIQLSLPYFRERGGSGDNGGGEDSESEPIGGRYLIFSSTSGALGVPGLGPFCATKYAVEGLVESMLYETSPFNILATLVEPGHVRRDDPPPPSSPDPSHTTTARPPPLPTFGHFSIKTASAPYASPTAPAGHAKRMVQWLGDKQPTSAVKAAELVWQLGHCRFPPLRLLLGGFAVESVRDRLRCVTEEIEDWRLLSFRGEGDAGSGVGRGGSREEEEEEEDGEEADGDVKMEGDGADEDGDGD